MIGHSLIVSWTRDVLSGGMPLKFDRMKIPLCYFQDF